MLRKFNYTGRKRIPRGSVSIHLNTQDGRPPTFDATYDLSALKLPGHAMVYVEAYHRASYMRFPFGCVSDMEVPENRELSEIEGGGSAQFRLKVVDETAEHGQVLAEADGITPMESGEDEGGRRPILPVVVRKDLGNQLWRIVFDTGDGRPALELNGEVEGIAQMARSDDTFLALVHPAIVRIVMHQVLRGANRIDTLDLPDDEGRGQWIEFAKSLPNVGDPPIPPESDFNDDAAELTQLEWIDAVVSAFCNKYSALERFMRVLSRRGD